MCSNNSVLWSTKSRVWNAGKGVLQSLLAGGLFGLGPESTCKPPRYLFTILALGFYLTLPLNTDNPAIASQEPLVSSNLSKTPFDINKVIEKAEHLPVLKEGYYIVEDSSYTAMFSPGGVIYTPVIPGGLPLDPFSLRVSQIETSSGEIFWRQEQVIKPVQKENTLVYKRTQDIEEVYDLRSKGVEQSWVFRRNPGFSPSSDLRIIMDVKTSLTGKSTSQMGLEFIDEEGTPYVKYSKAVIIDADGKVLEVAPTWDASNSKIVLNISGRWLAAAAYPVVVDPVLNTADIAVPTSSPSTSDESYPSIAFDGTNYLVVYQSGAANGTGTGFSDIKGVRVRATDGVIIDTIPITMAGTASRDEEHPSVAYDPAYNGGSYLVVWETWQTATLSDIWLTAVNAGTGAVGGTGLPVKISGNNTNRIMAYPSIACCDATNAYAVWARAGANNGNRLANLRGALINKVSPSSYIGTNPTGTLTNTGGPTSSPTTAPSVNPKIIYTNTTVNRYLLVWEDYADTNGNLSAQIYTVGGTWGTQWSVAVTGALLERYPAPAFDGTNFLVAYQRGATGGSADIYGQFVTTAGANQGAAFTISAAAGDEVTPALAWVTGTCSATPVNRYLAVWGQGTTIQAKPVTAAGGLESTIPVSVNTTSTKVSPAVTPDEGSCRYFVAWSDNRSGGGTPYDIYAQRVGYPNISNLTPNSGDAGSTTISINGMNFGNPTAGNRSNATNNVTLNGTMISESNINSWTDNGSTAVINFLIPAGTAPGTYPVTVTSGSWTSNSNSLTVTSSLQITTATLPVGYQWLSYSGATLAASGGTPPYSNWQVVFGALPAGLTLNPSTGAISGTPTGAEALETVSFTVQVTDSVSSTATKALSITTYKLTGITITDTGGTPVSPTINISGTFQFKARGTYSELSQYDISSISPLQWMSSNSTVATIGLTTGLATGSGAGTVTICAVTGGEACP